MSRLTQLAVAAASASIVLAACGGGGSTSNVPATGANTATPAQTQAAPPAASRTSFGTVKLTLALPPAVRAKSNQIVRAIPAVGKRPQFVDPVPTSGGLCNANVLDIYVDGSLVGPLDAGPEAPHSLCVTSTSDGTQSVTIPVFSTSNNQIVVVEWDPTGLQSILAIGETDFGGFALGSSPPITISLLMNAAGIGITDLAFLNPQTVNDGSYFPAGTCPSGTFTFGAYSEDATGVFVPLAGYGGTSTPTLTSTPNGTTVTQSTIPGLYTLHADEACDSITVQATTSNPAYAIFNHIFNQNDGVYPGIANLFSSISSSLNYPNYLKISKPSVSGSITIVPSL